MHEMRKFYAQTSLAISAGEWDLGWSEENFMASDNIYMARLALSFLLLDRRPLKNNIMLAHPGLIDSNHSFPTSSPAAIDSTGVNFILVLSHFG